MIPHDEPLPFSQLSDLLHEQRQTRMQALLQQQPVIFFLLQTHIKIPHRTCNRTKPLEFLLENPCLAWGDFIFELGEKGTGPTD